MSFVNVNGVKLSYRVYGTGFPVILIHGYGAKKEIWKPQIVELGKKYKVITYDIHIETSISRTTLGRKEIKSSML